MNWKKFFLFSGVGAVVPTLTTWLQHPTAFTFGNVGVPILGTLFATLSALFTHAPQSDATAAGQSTSTFPGPATPAK
jgi:hypothetical protein